MSDLVVFRTYLTNIDAELAHGALEAAGIESVVRSDDCGGTGPQLWMGGVDLLVWPEDVERANEILNTEAVPAEPSS
jgi:hypothetical protein